MLSDSSIFTPLNSQSHPSQSHPVGSVPMRTADLWRGDVPYNHRYHKINTDDPSSGANYYLSPHVSGSVPGTPGTVCHESLITNPRSQFPRPDFSRRSHGASAAALVQGRRLPSSFTCAFALRPASHRESHAALTRFL